MEEDLQKQKGLFENNDFDGKEYVHEFDHSRLKGQAFNVFSLMRDGIWRTLGEINSLLGYPEASISATLRDFRKDKFGSHTVEKRRRGNPKNGLFEYQLIVNQEGKMVKTQSKAQKKAISLSMITRLGTKLPEQYKQELREIHKWVSAI